MTGRQSVPPNTVQYSSSREQTHSRSIPKNGARTSHSLICQHQVKNRPVRVLEIEQPYGTHDLADSINTIFQHSLKKCCAEGCYHKTKQKNHKLVVKSF